MFAGKCECVLVYVLSVCVFTFVCLAPSEDTPKVQTSREGKNAKWNTTVKALKGKWSG